MKKILFSLLFLFVFVNLNAQIRELNTNGHQLRFKKVDTLFYAEFAGDQATAKNDPNSFIYSGYTGKIMRNEKFRVNEQPVFRTSFYIYEDGTPQAPTSKLFLKPVNEAAFIKKYAALGSIEPHPDFKGYYYLHVTNPRYTNGEAMFGLCEQLFNEKSVYEVEPVFIRLMRTENPLRPQEWNIRNTGIVFGSTAGADMRVENAWCYSTGTGIRVAVIDDGVDLTHPDLQANLLPGFDATGNNSGGAPLATNGHGTNCAGIIASVNNTIGTIGVAFNANIIPCRMGTVNAQGQFNTSDTWIANCFTQAVNRGAHVISNSWGGGSASTQITNAINNAVNNGRGGLGCVVLFSTGNNNAAVQYPATLTSVIAVGASTPCDTRKRSSSNPALVNPGVSADPEGVSCDGEFWWGSNFGTNLDLLAPGVLITTTDNVGGNGFVAGDYNDHFNGTSAGCPNAAAVAALILGANNTLTGAQARNILEQSCFKIPNGNFQANVAGQPNGTWSTQAGYGRVNADSAVRRAFAMRFSITGNSIICNTSDYSIANLPAGAIVTWSIPTNAGSVLQLAQNTPAANQLRITNQKWYSVSTTLTASITFPGCTAPAVTLTKQIANDNSTSASSPFQYFQESCYFYNVFHSSMSGTMYSNSSPLFVHQGCMVYVNLGNTSGLTVTSTGATPMFWAVGPTSYYANTLYFQLPLGSGGIPFTFKISGGGACYEKTLLFFSISNNGRYSFAASPNPVKNELLLDVKANTATEQKTVKPGSNNLVLNIYDFNTNRLQMTLRRNNDKAQHRINTSGLKPGYYVLQIVEGDQTQSLKFYKE